MLNGFRTQAIRAYEVNAGTPGDLAATAIARDVAREALATLEQLADAIRIGDAEVIDAVQAKVRASAHQSPVAA